MRPSSRTRFVPLVGLVLTLVLAFPQPSAFARARRLTQPGTVICGMSVPGAPSYVPAFNAVGVVGYVNCYGDGGLPDFMTSRLWVQYRLTHDFPWEFAVPNDHSTSNGPVVALSAGVVCKGGTWGYRGHGDWEATHGNSLSGIRNGPISSITCAK